MKLLPIVLLTLCFFTQSMLAMNNDYTQGQYASALAQRKHEKACDIATNLTIATTAATFLNVDMLDKEYKQYGCSSKCKMLAGSLVVMTFMTGTMAYLIDNNCGQ